MYHALFRVHIEKRYEKGILRENRGECRVGSPVASLVKGFGSHNCEGYTQYCERCHSGRK